MLTPKQQKAVAALHSSASFQEAAKKAGITDRTLRRWLQQDEFSEKVHDAGRRIIEGTVDELQEAAVEAIQILRKMIRDPINAPPSVRRSAARTLLEHSAEVSRIIRLSRRSA